MLALTPEHDLLVVFGKLKKKIPEDASGISYFSQKTALSVTKNRLLLTQGSKSHKYIFNNDGLVKLTSEHDSVLGIFTSKKTRYAIPPDYSGLKKTMDKDLEKIVELLISFPNEYIQRSHLFQNNK